MTPIDFRNETFAALKDRLTGLREKVWLAWISFGPGTTRDVSRRSGIDILTFRPRSTELCQMGAIVLAAAPEPSLTEGTYRARTAAEWQAWLESHQDEASRQLQLV